MNKKIKTKDKRQSNYTYEITEPTGKNFDPEFKPDLTPKEMLDLGIFGGIYFTEFDPDEFPKTWFKKYKHSDFYNKDLNYFKIKASQPLQVWQEKGWINEKHDPRGWIQWYFRYYLGRRLPKEDKRQIKRWKAMRRHLAQIDHNCRRGDMHCRPRQRQALLHWAYDSRKV